MFDHRFMVYLSICYRMMGVFFNLVSFMNHELFFPCMLACHAARAFGRGRADNLIRQPFCSSRHLRFAHLCPTMTHQWEGPQWRKTWQQEEQHFNSRQWSLHKLEIDFEEKSVTEVWRKMRPGDRHDNGDGNGKGKGGGKYGGKGGGKSGGDDNDGGEEAAKKKPAALKVKKDNKIKKTAKKGSSKWWDDDGGWWRWKNMSCRGHAAGSRSPCHVVMICEPSCLAWLSCHSLRCPWRIHDRPKPFEALLLVGDLVGLPLST